MIQHVCCNHIYKDAHKWVKVAKFEGIAKTCYNKFDEAPVNRPMETKHPKAK